MTYLKDKPAKPNQTIKWCLCVHSLKMQNKIIDIKLNVKLFTLTFMKYEAYKAILGGKSAIQLLYRAVSVFSGFKWYISGTSLFALNDFKNLK